MTQRAREEEKKRLVALMERSPVVKDCGCTWHEYFSALADDLLSNGVIVPPCKVGDTVYAIIEGRVLEGKVDEVWFDEDIGRWEFDVNTGFGFPMFPEGRIGTEVFFSRKEAEQAVKERSRQ